MPKKKSKVEHGEAEAQTTKATVDRERKPRVEGFSATVNRERKPKIEGFSLTAILRYVGANGGGPADAVRMLKGFGYDETICSPNTITAQLSDGRSGRELYGKVPDLPEELGNRIRSYIAPEPRPTTDGKRPKVAKRAKRKPKAKAVD